MSSAEKQRVEMVRRLRAEGIVDQQVLDAMGEVPRERLSRLSARSELTWIFR